MARHHCSQCESATGRAGLGRFWLMLVLAVAAAPLYVLAMPDANLTDNWSVESWGGSYDTYSGHPLQVASDWQRFTQSGTEPRFMKDTEYASLFGHLGAIPRSIEGDYSQNLWLGHPFTAGIYQQITVTPGKPYAAKSWMLSVYRTSSSQTDDKMLKQVGLDPNGGTDPSSSNIVWGEADGRDVSFVDVRTAATAQSSTITLFARVTSQDEVYPDWNAAWMDAIVLAEAPTVSASSPEFSPDTDFLVSWTNGQAAPGGSLTGQYDVQYKDGIDGEWITWKSKKSDTPATFSGEVGHTYYFRARAWQEYDPEGIELYGAYSDSEEGDTHTTVGRVATGYVRGNMGFAVGGATVAIPETTSSTVTDRTGHYQMALPDTGSYGLTADASGFTSPPPVPFTVSGDTILVPITLTVRPPDDGITDGDFEDTLSNHWTVSGSPAPQVQDTVVRSGERSLQLCDGEVTSAPRVEQSFTVNGMYEPVLSFYVNIPEMGDGDYVLVGRTTPDPAPLLTLADQYPDWTHVWVSLDVGEVYTGSLGVFFQASSPSDMQVYLDEVSVGRSPGGPIKSYCPVVYR